MTHGLDVSYVNWIICGTPVEKIKRIECVKLIFKPGPKKKKSKEKNKIRLILPLAYTTDDPIYM